jgi:type IV pilus assembly protein PilC
MSSFAYQAVDATGRPMRGTLSVASQNEALQRIREMGLFPVKLTARDREREPRAQPTASARRPGLLAKLHRLDIPLPLGRVKPRTLAVFTRQLATLIDAGMPLLRGLRILQQQETHPRLKRVIGAVGETIEGGGTLTEALSAHPRVFNGLYVNMVRAGEVSGALEITLQRLAEFMEKAEKIKGKVKAAMFYPVAVLLVAFSILALMMVFVVPRFQAVFDGLLNGAPMPAFTRFVMGLSEAVREQAPLVGLLLLGVVGAVALMLRTHWGRRGFDLFKLRAPAVGPVFRKSAISRLTRTLGTLLHSGVPVLQALTIVKETAGNKVVGALVGDIHESVKQGETVTMPLRNSSVFSPVYVGMVDVGEQTGALPDMLLKIADQCDDDVDNAVSAMTSLLEPILIIFLAVIVGGIVIAMFLPIIGVVSSDAFGGGAADE